MQGSESFGPARAQLFVRAIGDTMTGAQVLDDVREFVCRYVKLPSSAAEIAITLWIAHTHALEAADSTPYLSIQSPEKRSGKTRLLEVLELVVAQPLRTAGTSEAALFRSVANDPPPTLLVDELDAIFPKRPRPESEGLRGLLNAGHRRGSNFLRVTIVGKSPQVEQWPVFCAKALAGIGTPPDTIGDRSIVIRMQRRAPGESVCRFRHRKVSPEASGLRERIANWVAEVLGTLDPDPELPTELDDRAQDGWEPLMALADAAGGDWPTRARRAALELSVARQDEDADSLGVRLLGDIKSILDGHIHDRISSHDLAEALVRLELAPWRDLRGAPLTQRTLADILRRFDIRSKAVRFADGSNVKGYTSAQFADAWSRYCPQVDLLPTSADPTGQSPEQHWRSLLPAGEDPDRPFEEAA